MQQPPPGQPGVTITYDDAVMAANAAQTVRQEQEAGVIDKNYLKAIPGFLKAGECLFSLIAYICVELSLLCVSWSSTMGFFKFVAMAAFFTSLILWGMLLLKVPQRVLKCDCVNWPFFEFCYYAGVIVLYFFGNLFLAIHACTGSHKAGCAFGFFAMFVYMYNAFLAFRIWWSARQEARNQATSQPTVSKEEEREKESSHEGSQGGNSEMPHTPQAEDSPKPREQRKRARDQVSGTTQTSPTAKRSRRT